MQLEGFLTSRVWRESQNRNEPQEQLAAHCALVIVVLPWKMVSDLGFVQQASLTSAAVNPTVQWKLDHGPRPVEPSLARPSVFGPHAFRNAGGWEPPQFRGP